MYAAQRKLKLKWKKEAAGYYKTTCEEFWVVDNYTKEYGRAWNLFAKNCFNGNCINEIVDTYNTKSEAQAAADYFVKYCENKK